MGRWGVAAVLAVAVVSVAGCRRPPVDPHRSAGSSTCPNVRLALEVVDARFVTTIFNEGPEPLSLVDVGDGSFDGVQTPSVRWIVTDSDGAVVGDRPRQLCGTRDVVHPEDVFTLAPGEHRRLRSFLEPNPPPGHYRVRLAYTNDPGWDPGPTDDQHPEQARKVRAALETTRACTLESPAVRVSLPFRRRAVP